MYPVAGQSSRRRGFYSKDLMRDKRLQEMSLNAANEPNLGEKLRKRRWVGAGQAFDPVKIRLEVVDHNGEGRTVGRHFLCGL